MVAVDWRSCRDSLLMDLPPTQSSIAGSRRELVTVIVWPIVIASTTMIDARYVYGGALDRRVFAAGPQGHDI